jgi:hypothetical protein
MTIDVGNLSFETEVEGLTAEIAKLRSPSGWLAPLAQ